MCTQYLKHTWCFKYILLPREKNWCRCWRFDVCAIFIQAWIGLGLFLGLQKFVPNVADQGAEVLHIWDEFVKILTTNSSRTFGHRKYLFKHKLKAHHRSSFTQNFRSLSIYVYTSILHEQGFLSYYLRNANFSQIRLDWAGLLFQHCCWSSSSLIFINYRLNACLFRVGLDKKPYL